MQSTALEWVKVVGSLLVSWPVAALIIAVMFRKQILDIINRFTTSPEGGKAELGPLKIELGKLAEEGQQAVGRLNRITELTAETRLLEFEILDSMFQAVFTEEQRERMRKQIKELRELTRKTE